MKLDSIILTKSISNLYPELTSPEKIKYHVFNHYAFNQEGEKVYEIYAEKFNKADYVIMLNNREIMQRSPLNIVNENHSEEDVLKELYKQANKITKEHAKRCSNVKMFDLTGNVPLPNVVGLLHDSEKCLYREISHYS